MVVGQVAPLAVALSGAPLWTGQPNQTSAHYGWSVAAAGDVNGDGFSDVIVGARDYDAGQSSEGRAFVYHGSAAGPAPAASWTAEPDLALAFFGQTVAPAGDVNGDGFADVVVGAANFAASFTGEGRAFVYVGSSGGLAAAPAWTKDGGKLSATLGSGAASAGDVNGDGFDDLIVGSRGYTGSFTSEGRAQVFLGGPAGLDSTAVWTVLGGQMDAALGWSVAGAGDLNADGYADVIVGAFFFDGGLTDEGRADVYLGGPGGPAATPAWTAEGNLAGATFGWSVAGAGDVNGDGYADVIVGARYHTGSFLEEGRAYVFAGTPAGVAAAPAWFFDGGEIKANLGWSVGTAGDVNGDGYADVIVGAYREDEGWIDAGRVLVFAGSATGLGAAPIWTAGGGQQGAQLGWSVSGAGDVDGDGFADVIAGADFWDGGQMDEGAAFVWRGGGALPGASPAWRGAAGPGAISYGASLETAGDVNGDGRSDLLAADPLWSGVAVGAGRVDLYLGTPAGPDASPDWTDAGVQSGASHGRSASGAGDVDGDGYDDVIVGAPLHDTPVLDAGRVVLFGGSSGGLATTESWEVLGNAASLFLGQSVCGAGDLDADGFADVVVGAPGGDEVHVFLGSPSGLPFVPDLVLSGTQSGAQFGWSVAPAGDVDGDGFSDVLVGEPGAANGEAEEGRAHLFLGTNAGLAPAPARSVEANQIGARLGDRVAAAGDVNGDGFSDVLLVARLWDGGEEDEGRAFLYLGAPSGLDPIPAWTAEADQAGAELGEARGVGDLDGDGLGDVVTGASLFTGSSSLEGRISLWLGTASGLAAAPAVERLGGAVLARLGERVAGPGDVHGDGWNDLIAAAPGWADSVSSGGAAFLHAGNGGGGLDRAARQLRAGTATPVALLGASDSQSGFVIEAALRSAAGRARVALAWDVERLGIAFGGAAALGPTVDTGAPVAGIGSRATTTAAALGLSFSRAYRWRCRTVSASPWFPRTPWQHLPGNAPGETDLRTAPGPVGVASVPAAPVAAVRLALSPSPFRDVLRIAFRTPAAGSVALDVHDVGGRLVAVLLAGPVGPGEHAVSWDGRGPDGPVAPGVYFVRLSTPSGGASERTVRLR
ncbi:MAG: FG-GAP-like repeat-containing protein [Candidatus Eiseniibacteriota bacterium]